VLLEPLESLLLFEPLEGLLLLGLLELLEWLLPPPDSRLLVRPDSDDQDVRSDDWEPLS
jgi:hypothetical protein